MHFDAFISTYATPVHSTFPFGRMAKNLFRAEILTLTSRSSSIYASMQEKYIAEFLSRLCEGADGNETLQSIRNMLNGTKRDYQVELVEFIRTCTRILSVYADNLYSSGLFISVEWEMKFLRMLRKHGVIREIVGQEKESESRGLKAHILGIFDRHASSLSP
ncbi:hypothetical protein EJ08DRAFT_732464 [Tothia fuscella]|uniref:Uncharacterized protein n=1 Tax=Tothia fuscella TaxID=1048955 RepID=A0A9P4NW29_9PEZI|nr:hypothetical protein EJ08DRAFT_732464 [Tothia fuscella]